MKPWGDERPKTFGDCQDRPMPCPWVGCKHHTLLDVTGIGSIVVNEGMVRDHSQGSRQRGKQNSRRLPVWPRKTRKSDDARRCDEIVELLKDLKHSCILKMVDDERKHTLEQTGEILNVTRERVRQIETIAFNRIRATDNVLEGFCDSLEV